MRRGVGLLWVAGFVLALALRVGAQAPAPREETRAAMREIFSALSEILPRCLSRERFEAPADRESVQAALAKLASHADALASHAGGKGDEMAFRGQALARDARRAQARFASGSPVDARFLALHLTESCVGCHARLPADKASSFAAGLTAKIEPKALTPSERARLDIATRQFDHALDTYESLLTSPPPAAGEAVRMADLTEYLIVALRVKRDPERAVKLLEKLEERAETPPDVRRLIGPWRTTLERERKVLRGAPSLATARRLVQSGRSAREYAYSRAGLIHDLLASSVLHQLLEQPKLPSAQRAEAYYLVGLTDSQARSSPWLSDGAWYLEAAIRTQPHSDLALRAFEAYEDMTVLEWTGSSGTQLPEDVVADLDRLRALATPGAH